jgi:uncharacterized protein YgiM (DUF1202 family)
MKILAATALFFAIALPATAQAQVGPAYSTRSAQGSPDHRTVMGSYGYACTAERGSSLAVRSGPGKNYRVLTKVRDGNGISLDRSQYGKDGFKWWLTSDNGRQGWIRADYVCRVSVNDGE